MKTVICSVAVLCGLALPGSANTNLITNGTFMPGGNGIFSTLSSTTTFANGDWTVTAGSIDWIGTYWTAPVGYSVDLNGTAPNIPGTISQTVSTVAGQEYQLTFFLAGNPDGNPLQLPNPKTATVTTVGNQTFTIFANVNGNEPTATSGWTAESLIFVAAGSTTAISFTGDPATTSYGPVVADVAMSAVPEPGVYGVLALGMSGLWVFARRKRHA